MSTERRMASPHRLSDERGIVIGWLLKIAIVLAIVGMALVEGGAIVFSKLQAQDIAESAATAGAAKWGNTHNIQAARLDAELNVSDKAPRARITSFTVMPNGTVRVSVRLRANTVLVQHVDFLRDLTVSSATADASPPTANV